MESTSLFLEIRFVFDTVVDSFATFEDSVLGGLFGSFFVFTTERLPPRIYPDAGGTIPIVYCPESGRIASSASMMLDENEYRERFLRERHGKTYLE